MIQYKKAMMLIGMPILPSEKGDGGKGLPDSLLQSTQPMEIA